MPTRLSRIMLAVLAWSFATNLLDAETLRIASYNIQDKPTNGAQRSDLRAIINAIGNETVQGVGRPIDILAFQEGPQQTGNYNNVEADFESVFGRDYDVVYATADPFGCRTGFVYCADTVQLISSQSIDNMGFTHRPCLASFLPVGGEEGDTFSMISLHLKAGLDSSDADQRGQEAMAVRDIVAGLPADQPVIFVGDFNMKSSQELAWLELELAGARETINAPVGLRIAEWNDSLAFHAFHTQDCTGSTGGLDDRFDAIYINDQFLDNLGIEYVQGSLRTLGNNGTHTMNSSVASGNGALAVQNNLMDFSDHLPIFADFDWGVLRTTPSVNLFQPVTTTYTVRSSGPVSGGSSLDIEGTSNGNFASFGVIDINLSGFVPGGEIASRVEEIQLSLVQDNESYTADGPISVYVASPAATAIAINSGIQFQAGSNGLDCVPVQLSSGAERTSLYPSVHHDLSSNNLPDGTQDSLVLNGDAIRTAITVALTNQGTVRLIVVPDLSQTTATFAGYAHGSLSGPALSGLYDISRNHPNGDGGSRPPRGLQRAPVFRR